jgi:Ca2+/Na+ antiporter
MIAAMIINILLLVLVFGAEKKKVSPYLAALLLGAIKAAIYLIFFHQIAGALITGAVYAALAAGFVYFLKRIDRRENNERPEVPEYQSPGSETIKFKWEYIPLVVLLLLIVAGADMILG